VPSAVSQFLKGIYRTAIDFVAPPICLSCGIDLQKLSTKHQYPLAESATDDFAPTDIFGRFCPRCRPLVPLRVENPCVRCGAPLGPYQQAKTDCVHCRDSRFSFSGVVSLGAYAESLKQFCQRGKSPASQPLVHFLARILSEHEQDRLRSWRCSAIVNVPMYWSERIGRRIHPNETISTELSHFLGIPHQRRWLRQTRKTRQQHSLPPTERRNNVRGAYVVSRQRSLAGQRILLVDDILTTGATAHVCSRALLEAGAAEVFVAVLARGLKRR